MCTLVILRRPGHDWPLIVAANRDEMADRPWRPPARHWPDRDHVTAGMDELAGGTWLALGDDGIVAAILNRRQSLGPADDKRSRGELPLEAVDHAEARVAAEALAMIEPASYRSFNLVVADALEAYWIKSTGEAGTRLQAFPMPEGLSMITAYDLNDAESPRMRRNLGRFRAAKAPDPENGDWWAWQALLGTRDHDADAGPGGAMTVVTDTGFGTVSSSLIALPSPEKVGETPRWLFAAGRPDEAPYQPVRL